MSPKPDDSDAVVDQEMPFLAHLVELRDRLMRAVLGILAVFVPLVIVANPLYSFVAEPLLAHLPAGTSMIATGVATPLLTPLKLAIVAAIFIALPWILHQFWGFVAPGLYQHEKRLVVPLLVSSTLLFYLGAAFAYFVVFPLIFAFLTTTAPEGVVMMTDIAQYLDFVLTLFLAFGVAFEVPIATFLLVKMGIAEVESLKEKRPYIIVGAFVIGMLLTPPDIISQTLLAVPMWLLFELGLFFSARFAQEPVEEEEKREHAYPEDYEEPSDEELEAELERLDAEEEAADSRPEPQQAARRQGELNSQWQQEMDLLGDDGDEPPPPQVKDEGDGEIVSFK